MCFNGKWAFRFWFYDLIGGFVDPLSKIAVKVESAIGPSSIWPYQLKQCKVKIQPNKSRDILRVS